MTEDDRPRYSADIAWSEEDAAWVAVCPEFEGVSAIGDTLEEAARELTQPRRR